MSRRDFPPRSRYFIKTVSLRIYTTRTRTHTHYNPSFQEDHRRCVIVRIAHSIILVAPTKHPSTRSYSSCSLTRARSPDVVYDRWKERERERIRSYELLPRMEQDIFFSSSFLFLWRIILGGSCTSRHGCGGSPIGGGSKRNLLEIFARDRWRERERGRECVCVYRSREWRDNSSRFRVAGARYRFTHRCSSLTRLKAGACSLPASTLGEQRNERERERKRRGIPVLRLVHASRENDPANHRDCAT